MTNSSIVNACVLGILSSQFLSPTLCPGATWPTSSQSAQISEAQQAEDEQAATATESPEERTERMSHRSKSAPERMSVKAPVGDVPLGNPLEITLTLAPGKVPFLGTWQSNPHRVVYQSNGTILGPVDHTMKRTKIVKQEGNTITVEVIPVQLGPVDLHFDAVYSDNADVSQTIHLNVVPSAKGLDKFEMDGGYLPPVLILGDEEFGHGRLTPILTYAGLEDPIWAENTEKIKFSVEQPDDPGSPVIQVDSNGIVHPLRVGKAVIVGNFDGVEDRFKVVVAADESGLPSQVRGVRP